MAASKEHDFVEKLTDDNMCSICTSILKDPVLTDCCGQHYCAGCLNNWLQKQSTCPHCREQCFKHMKYLPKKRQIKALKIYCPNRSKGCVKISTVGECSTHLETCLFVEVPCTNKCGAKMKRKELQNHTANECFKRTVKCYYCSKKGMYKDIISRYHGSKCPSLPLDCPNNCGFGKIPRKDLPDHQKKCPLELVKCPFFEAGCKQKIPRKELVAHKASESHLELMMETMTCRAKATQNQLENVKQKSKASQEKLEVVTQKSKASQEKLVEVVTQRLQTMQDQLNQISLNFAGLASCVTKQLATIESEPQKTPTAINHIKTTLEVMSTMLEQDKQYYLPLVVMSQEYVRSPSFYIQPGYKVFVNGHNICRMYLEKGENDDKLDWPMPGMEIDLINIDNKLLLRTVTICPTCCHPVNRLEGVQTEQVIMGDIVRPIAPPLPKDSILITIKSHHCARM